VITTNRTYQWFIVTQIIRNGDVWTPICFVGARALFMLFVFIYLYSWCPIQVPFQMIFVSFNNNTTGATSGTETAYLSGTSEFIPVLFVGFALLNI
jgi:hypothetical protein